MIKHFTTNERENMNSNIQNKKIAEIIDVVNSLKKLKPILVIRTPIIHAEQRANTQKSLENRVGKEYHCLIIESQDTVEISVELLTTENMTEEQRKEIELLLTKEAKDVSGD